MKEVEGTYGPDWLILNDVRSIEHNAQAVEGQSRVFPKVPRVHFREVP
jgi:hypothetical protein